MTRKRRHWHPDGFYHITMRGNNRQNIFVSETDVSEYYRILTYMYSRHVFEIHAFCIMTNHVHFLLRSPEVHLGTLMQNINKRYSDYYRKKYDYVGQIYENRYFSKETPNPLDLLKVSAYIHLNPITTKKPMVAKLEEYPYSSYPAYYNNKTEHYPFIRLDILPGLLPEEMNPTKNSYANWCIQQKEKDSE